MSVTIEEINAAIARKEAEDEMQQIDAAIAAKQLPPGTTSDAVVEPIKAIASGAAGSVVGGLAGTVQAINPWAEEGAGEQAVRGVQEAMTIQPETQAGQEGLEGLFSAAKEITNMLSLGGMVPSVVGGVTDMLTGGDLESGLRTAVDIKTKGMPQVMADKTFEVTNSPLAATSALLFPDLGEMMLGGGLIKSVTPTNASKALAVDIQTGGKEKIYMDNGAGFIVNGPIEAKKAYKEAIRQGVDPGAVPVFMGSHPTDKIKMQSMMDIFKKTRKDKLYAMDNRPSDVAGTAMLERVDYVRDVNKKAASNLDVEAKKLINQPVDISNITRKFASDMDGYGIKLGPDGEGGFVAIFKDSSLPPGDYKTIKEVVRQMSRLSKKPIDGYAAHELKKIIDRNVSYGKKNVSLSGESEIMLKEFRHGLDEALDTKFESYNDVNTTYAQTRTALDDFQTAMGKKIDLTSKNANKAVGVKLRGLTSNIPSRTPLDDAITLMNETATNYGGRFDDSIKVQMVLAEELNKMRPAAETSLQGEVGKAARRAATQSRGEAALDVAVAVKDKALGISEENAIKAIEALLK